jgi:hypothetical protein
VVFAEEVIDRGIDLMSQSLARALLPPLLTMLAADHCLGTTRSERFGSLEDAQ